MTTEELEELEEIKKYCNEERERQIKRNAEWEAFLKDFNSAEQEYLNDPQRKRWFDLGNGHTLMIQWANRGLEDDFLVEFYEDCTLLDREYATAEVIKDIYDIDI
ncbi:MAG: hypothetical protein HDT43_00630 [Ruminococcaceae bacterium]|nr:hypothetical protein [Oscillospiraceae bacterium]